ncbi:hypothetical protein J6590_106357 [Homalodisca vitripennis]|nr:hypothetical protein J6590_106357 [Homalodisca vitripennis]
MRQIGGRRRYRLLRISYGNLPPTLRCNQKRSGLLNKARRVGRRPERLLVTDGVAVGTTSVPQPTINKKGRKGPQDETSSIEDIGGASQTSFEKEKSSTVTFTTGPQDETSSIEDIGGASQTSSEKKTEPNCDFYHRTSG